MSYKINKIQKDDIESPDFFLNFFKKKWNNSKPLAKLFKTDYRYYLYDTGTNKIIGCDKYIYNLLEKLFSSNLDLACENFISEFSTRQFINAAGCIKNTIEKEKILSINKSDKFIASEVYTNYKDLIDSSLGTLTLEVTEQCNLRCEYCVYNSFFKDRRNHGEKSMELNTAFRAIDYLKKHSYKSDKINIVFYGGEPLLKFSFIKSCVKYTKSVFKNKKIGFYITTNATILTPGIAKFFYDNDFQITVSIDGPEEIHDSYRKDLNGNGSYKKTVIGLKRLIDLFGYKSKNKIRFSMVYTPPFSENRLNCISELWKELSWLPQEIKMDITYPSVGSIPPNKLSNRHVMEDKGLRQWSFEKYFSKYIGTGDSHPIADEVIKKPMAQLVQRSIHSKPSDNFFLNGCCMPGQRKIYVSTDGAFRLCERISENAPTIGDVYSGIDFNTIKKIYIDEYVKISLPLCAKCWAIKMCSSCYIDVFKDGKLDINEKKTNCIFFKDSQEKFLKYYCSLIEQDPNGLDYLYKYKLNS